MFVIVGSSEALTYIRAAEFFTHHESQLQQRQGNEALLASVRHGKRSLVRESTLLHIGGLFGAIVASSLTVNLLWDRRLTRPVNLLRHRMNTMSRGTWTQSIPIEHDDEMGRLLKDFNLLGPRLTFAAHQFAAASKLAAMARMGQQVTRRTNMVRNRLMEIQASLSDARLNNQPVPQSAIHQMTIVSEDLRDLTEDLDSEFNDELVRQGLRSPSPRRDELIAS